LPAWHNKKQHKHASPSPKLEGREDIGEIDVSALDISDAMFDFHGARGIDVSVSPAPERQSRMQFFMPRESVCVSCPSRRQIALKRSSLGYALDASL
jgi:hypothetical protein